MLATSRQLLLFYNKNKQSLKTLGASPINERFSSEGIEHEADLREADFDPRGVPFR